MNVCSPGRENRTDGLSDAGQRGRVSVQLRGRYTSSLAVNCRHNGWEPGLGGTLSSHGSSLPPSAARSFAGGPSDGCEAQCEAR